MPRKKKPKGRPATRTTLPDRIPDTPENIIQVALKTRSKPERDLLQRKAGQPVSGPP
jgi:hypothetical protein